MWTFILSKFWLSYFKLSFNAVKKDGIHFCKIFLLYGINRNVLNLRSKGVWKTCLYCFTFLSSCTCPKSLNYFYCSVFDRFQGIITHKSNNQSQASKSLFAPLSVSKWLTHMGNGQPCGRASLQLWASLTCAHMHWCTRTLLRRYKQTNTWKECTETLI